MAGPIAVRSTQFGAGKALVCACNLVLVTGYIFPYPQSCSQSETNTGCPRAQRRCSQRLQDTGRIDKGQVGTDFAYAVLRPRRAFPSVSRLLAGRLRRPICWEKSLYILRLALYLGGE